jgi:hypothetical protein
MNIPVFYTVLKIDFFPTIFTRLPYLSQYPLAALQLDLNIPQFLLSLRNPVAFVHRFHIKHQHLKVPKATQENVTKGHCCTKQNLLYPDPDLFQGPTNIQ